MNRREKFNKEVEELRVERYKNSDTWKTYLKDINVFKNQLLNN